MDFQTRLNRIKYCVEDRQWSDAESIANDAVAIRSVRTRL